MLDNIKPQIERYITDYEVKQNNPAVKKTDPNKIKMKMQRLKDLYINELIDLDDYRKEYEQYKQELEELSTTAAADKKDLSVIRSFLELDLQNIYDKLSSQEKHALWSSIIDKIIISDDREIEIIFL